MTNVKVWLIQGPGGSRYLCDIVAIETAQKYHDFYDQMLNWCTSPLEITAYGKTWNYYDYFSV